MRSGDSSCSITTSHRSESLCRRLHCRENVLIITFNAVSYLLCYDKLKKCKLSDVDKKAYERLYHICGPESTDHLKLHKSIQLRPDLKFDIIEPQTQEFVDKEIDINKVVFVNSMETLNTAIEHLRKVDQVSVDLEGALKKNGSLELVQCGTKDKIFVFDIYQTKKNAQEEASEATIELYKKMAAFLKDLMEDSKVCKVFHDGRKDLTGTSLLPRCLPV